jgi:hypothetical protein
MVIGQTHRNAGCRFCNSEPHELEANQRPAMVALLIGDAPGMDLPL